MEASKPRCPPPAEVGIEISSHDDGAAGEVPASRSPHGEDSVALTRADLVWISAQQIKIHLP